MDGQPDGRRVMFASPASLAFERKWRIKNTRPTNGDLVPGIFPYLYKVPQSLGLLIRWSVSLWVRYLSKTANSKKFSDIQLNSGKFKKVWDNQ